MVARVAGHELRLTAPGARHRPDRIRAGAVRDEGDRRAVGRPGGLPVVRRVPREPAEPAAVRRHGDDVAAAVAIGGEGDAETVGRPGGLAVRARMRHDRVQAGARRIRPPTGRGRSSHSPGRRRYGLRPATSSGAVRRRPAASARPDSHRRHRMLQSVNSPPSVCRTNAICEPSGEYAGSVSAWASFVSAIGAVPSAAMLTISSLPGCSRDDCDASVQSGGHTRARPGPADASTTTTIDGESRCHAWR